MGCAVNHDRSAKSAEGRACRQTRSAGIVRHHEDPTRKDEPRIGDLVLVRLIDLDVTDATPKHFTADAPEAIATNDSGGANLFYDRRSLGGRRLRDGLLRHVVRLFETQTGDVGAANAVAQTQIAEIEFLAANRR
jgi:hypothetical protein